MSVAIDSSSAVITTAVLALGAIAVGFATFRSKLPQATIKIQNDSIAALKEQNDLQRRSISELTKIVVELKARVEVLETLPIKDIRDSLVNVATSLNDLKELGVANQNLMRAYASGQSNITINK